MKYKTKQGEALAAYLKSVAGTHVTVGDILSHLKSQGISIGMATVYRRIDEMLKEGILRKYIVDEGSPACFEYVGEKNKRGDLLHCKCEHCGKLFHIQCRQFDLMQHHLEDGHAFLLDPLRTVLYGTCEDCR